MVYSSELVLYSPKGVTQPEGIDSCHLTKLTNILNKASKGKYSKDKAIELKACAKDSI